MKILTNKSFLVILCLLLSFSAKAYTFQNAWLYYRITSDSELTVEVSSVYSEERTEYDIPETVTHNGSKYSVTGIGYRAFKNCYELTSVTILNSVTYIGENAFYRCSGLTSIIIPKSVTSIGNQAFFLCSRLTSVTIGNSVTNIGSEAFRSCSGLTSITIGNSVTTIGWSAFEGCTGLTSITIPNSVTEIETHSFFGCSGLSSITIPNSVTNIGSSAFKGCVGLASAIISNNITTISSSLFEDCTGLTSITIPNSVTNIESSAFSGCSGFTSIEIPNDLTNIGDGAFSGCKKLTSITIPNKVINIGSRAFYGCTGLTLFAIPNSVTTIGENAFNGCSGLKIITVAEGNQNYSTLNGILYDKEKTKIIHVPQVLEGSVIIPNGVTNIESYAFSGRYKLSSIDIPNSVTTIGENAFGSCTGLTSITIPDKVTDIGDYAFHECSRLTSVIIGNSVTNIGIMAFEDCFGLTSVTIGNSLSNFNGAVFWGCSNIKEFIVTENNQNYSSQEGILYNKEKTNIVMVPKAIQGNISIPSSLTSIRNQAFKDCSELTSITIPNSVTSIEESAFENCKGITSITIPNNVTSIGSSAFYGCKGIKEIYSLNPTPPTCGEYCFSNQDKVTLYVPIGYKSAYQAAYMWGYFKNILELDENENKEFSVTTIYNNTQGKVLINGNESQSVTITGNKSVTFTISPSIGYDIDKILLNKDDVTNRLFNNNYIIEKLTENVTLEVTFKDKFLAVNTSFNEEQGNVLINNEEVNSKNIKEGETVIFKVTPNTGYKTEKIILNHKDITNELVDNQYITCNLIENIILSVVFAKTGDSGISTSTSNDIKVYASKGNITVKGASADTPIQIYSTSGELIHNSKTVDGITTIKLSESGIYLVKIENNTYKVNL